MHSQLTYLNCRRYEFSMIPLGKQFLKPNCNYPTLTYQFVDLLDDLSLTQLATTPTRVNNTLDLVITNNPSLVTACRVMPGVSDHDAVLTEINIKPLRNKQTPRKIPLYKQADWEGHLSLAEAYSQILTIQPL